MKTLLVVLALGLMACESQQERLNTIQYMKDDRTHLCYATYWLGQTYGSLTNVPCSPEVEQAIRDDAPKTKAK